MPAQKITLDSSTAWTLAYNNVLANGTSTLLQQESGTLSAEVGIAGAFPKLESGECSMIASLYWPYNRPYESEETSLWPEDYTVVNEEQGSTPGTVDLHEWAYVETPLNANKLVSWLQTNTPESPYSTHLYLKETDKQAWTYVTDFTLHPKTPNVEINRLPFNYYLHARVRADNKLEFAFFDAIIENIPSAVDFDLANIHLEGGDPKGTKVQSLQYLCGDQAIAPLRVAGKDEAEAFLLDNDRKLLRARCPKFLGTLMHSGAQTIKVGYHETPNQEQSTEVISYYGHIWSYWGTIENNILYIVGIPIYQGDETGFVPQISNYGDGYFNYKHVDDLPPTYPMASPYIYDGINGNVSYEFDTWFSEWNTDNTIADTNKEFREAFAQAYSRNTFIKGWFGTDYPHSGIIFYDSSRCTVKQMLKDRTSESAVSETYTLAAPSVRLEETVLQDSVSEGFNSKCTLVSDRGGFYSLNGGIQTIEYIDSTENSATTYYGNEPGVIYKDNAPLRQIGESEDDVSNGTVNKVCSGFVSIPTQFPSIVYPDNENQPKGWTVHAFNVMQKGNVYTIWTSSFTSAYTIEGEVTLDQTKEYTTDYNDIPGTLPPDPGPGPGPIKPEPEPEPDPEPGPGPSPGPHPNPPNPGPSQWTWGADVTQYIYHSGSDVFVRTLSSPVTSAGRIYTFEIEVADYTVQKNQTADIEVSATVSPGNAGSYIDGRDNMVEDTLTLYYGISASELDFSVSDSNAALATEATGTASVTCTIDADISFNLCQVTSSSADFASLQSSNVISLSHWMDNKVVVADYASMTKRNQINKHYRINRRTGILSNIVINKELKASLSTTTISGTSDNSVGLKAPTVSLTAAVKQSETGGAVTVTGPITVNSIYTRNFSVSPSTLQVSITNATQGYDYDADKTANGSINQARGTTSIEGNSTVTISSS